MKRVMAGGRGVAAPQGSAADGWIVTRNIRLGDGVPGYPADDRP